MKEAFLHPKEEMQEASDPEVETQEVISEHKQDEAGPPARRTDLGGPVLPALRKLAISGNLPQIMSSRTRSRWVHTGVEGSALQRFLPTIIEGDEEGDGANVLVYGGGDPMALQVKVDILESRVGDMRHRNRKTGSR